MHRIISSAIHFHTTDPHGGESISYSLAEAVMTIEREEGRSLLQEEVECIAGFLAISDTNRQDLLPRVKIYRERTSHRPSVVLNFLTASA